MRLPEILLLIATVTFIAAFVGVFTLLWHDGVQNRRRREHHLRRVMAESYQTAEDRWPNS